VPFPVRSLTEGIVIFEDLPTSPDAEGLIDKAFSRGARTGRAKSGKEAQESMLRTAANICSDNLENVVTAWPDIERIDPFYYELADAIVDVDELRQSLSKVTWAAEKTDDIKSEYLSKIRTADADLARKHRKQAYARLADVVEQVDEDLVRIQEARDDLRDLPDLRPDEPAIVVAGFPNVGKSSFVNEVTRASNETASYPFTTTGVAVGHFEHDRVKYQLVDTPGLLDRKPEERNDVESQAVSALTHLADCVLFVVDASLDCGYPIGVQLELRDSVEKRFDVPVLTVCNKSDRSREVEADYYMSIAEDDNVEAVLDAAIEAVDYEPELPFEEG
jgi:nucleolar GTP-binding protein